MKIYVVGVPHTQTSPRFSTCAFTMKAWNLCRMLSDLGHHVVHLGNGGSHPACAEHVDLMPIDRFEKVCGHPGTDNYRLLGGNGEHGAYLRDWSNNLERELKKRIGAPWTEIVCSVWGADDAIALRDIGAKQFVVESGIGYRYTFAKYRVFESYAWMHFHWGMEQRFAGNGWTDAVIPNAFDPAMFKYQEKKDNYILFMGRLNQDKGVGLAIDIAREIGSKIVIVGQGDPCPYLKGNPHASYVAPVGPTERSELMGRARVLMCPTFYTEMFGGVAVEAMMSGTPVLTTDWGAFPETVLHGITGYRCRTREQFVWAAKNIERISPLACRQWAESNFGIQKVGGMYDEYFRQIESLARAGWNEPNQKRMSLDWLTKTFPSASLCGGTPNSQTGHCSAEASAPTVAGRTGNGVVALVTSIFSGIRDDRPETYYTRPLMDFAEKMSGRGENLRLVIAGNTAGLESIRNADRDMTIDADDLDGIVREVWNEPLWQTKYADLISCNPTHCHSAQAKFAKLVGVYLAKYPLMKRVLDSDLSPEAVLWYDAGHWVSWGLNHDVGRYAPEMLDGVNPSSMMTKLLSLSREYGVIGMLGHPGGNTHNFHMPIEWMKRYWHDTSDPPYFMGSFWLVHASAFGDFFNELICQWKRLIGDGVAGVDENALTLAAWTHHWKGLTYSQWGRLLRSESDDSLM